MPIQFRCPACRGRLSITRRKAGVMVDCPSCSEPILVPAIDDASNPEEAREQEPLAAAPEEETEPLPIESPVSPHVLQEPVDSDDEDEGFQLTRRRPEGDELDMTPMVDVTFLLLIFFMITASFSLQKTMETEAPEPENEGFAQMPTLDDLADESVIVEIDENDAIFVDDEAVSGPVELEDVLRRKMSGEQKREMIIESHYQAKHGTVVAVTDAGMTVGMQRIRRTSRTDQ